MFIVNLDTWWVYIGDFWIIFIKGFVISKLVRLSLEKCLITESLEFPIEILK